MKAFQIGNQTGLDSLVAVQMPEPVAGPGEVIVAPRLVGLINRDLQILKGTYGGKLAPTRVPVAEGVGIVTSVGAGVGQVAPGDRVVSGHFPTWLEGRFDAEMFAHDLGVTHDGWLAEKVSLPASALIKVPASLEDEDVAALASAAVTAWNALVDVARIKAGDLVLCLGTGGVSMAALQLAKLHGARVAITSSSDDKLELARRLGADITVNYRTHPDWAEAVVQLSGGGADVIIETGGQDTLGQSIKAAANATIVVIGVTPGASSPIPDYVALIRKNVTIRGIANGSRAMFVDLLRAIEQHRIKTLHSKTFRFDEAPQALDYFAKAQHVGKVLIRL
ncbi:zinc-dependent alcohol dehydrogenase family protein [Xanthomonas axonopodis]|uniref:zinc-dependent alcohol dehydrogenase family protein n=1 Tax=Xanthomonas axonopodis TaxID=53413 RepID=UPI000F00A499|nr:NAD(P)-dependent alcohol dehydrogenase [Xanthomonas axonopodis]AYO93799.1 NAD(P)-dependent alcohol dehydrogenase [Xanthomonas axonopodis pv. commiphoreae]